MFNLRTYDEINMFIYSFYDIRNAKIYLPNSSNNKTYPIIFAAYSLLIRPFWWM
jgi:hypothetical protein